jgi:hypothetical protein
MVWTFFIGCAGIFAISVPIVVTAALVKREKVKDNLTKEYLRWGGFGS